MAMKYSGRELKWMKSTIGDGYIGVLRVEGNGTSTPDGDEPASITWARTGVGTYTFTFPALEKPRRIISCLAAIEEASPTLSAKFTGYVASTGVGTVQVYESGASAASSTLKMYSLGLQATLANGAGPSSSDPATDTVWARSNEGVYTVTWSAGTKPLEITSCIPKIVDATSVQRVEFVSYDYATGIMTLNTYGVDLNTADDCAGKDLHVLLLCTDTALAATTAAQKAAQVSVPAAADITDKTLVLTFVASNSAINDA